MKSDSPTFIDYFADLTDPRVEDRCARKLTDILFIATCAVICRADVFTDMEEFGVAKQDWLRQFLELPNSLNCPQAFLLTIPLRGASHISSQPGPPNEATG